MSRASSLLPIFAISGLLACKGELSTNPEHARAGKAEQAELPMFRMLPWGTELARSPGGPTLRLESGGEGHGRGRAVRVIEAQRGWWLVETVATHELDGLVAKPIEHLDVYRLRLYVKAGVGEPVAPIPAGPEAPPPKRDTEVAAAALVGMLGLLGDPPLQSGATRSPELSDEWRVEPGTPVYWPDGSEAGQVALLHAFVDPGRSVAAAAGQLRCFDIVFGPSQGDTELCFPTDAVYTAQPMQSAFASLWDDTGEDGYGLLIGEEIDDAYGYGYGLGGIAGGVEGGVEGGVPGGVVSGMVGAEIDELDGGGSIGTIGHGGGGGGGGGSIDSIVLPEPELPAVALRSFSFTGSGSDAAKRVVQTRTRTIASCVAEASSPAGKLEVQLDIAEDGKVGDIRLQQPDHPLAACVRGKLERWRFPSGAPGTAKFELSWD